MLIRNLYYYTWILSEQLLDNIIALDVLKVNMQSTFCIGKGHLKQCCDKTTGRDVMSSEYPSTTDKLLNGVETVAEVLWLFDSWNVTTNLSETLGECGTS